MKDVKIRLPLQSLIDALGRERPGEATAEHGYAVLRWGLTDPSDPDREDAGWRLLPESVVERGEDRMGICRSVILAEFLSARPWIEHPEPGVPVRGCSCGRWVFRAVADAVRYARRRHQSWPWHCRNSVALLCVPVEMIPPIIPHTRGWRAAGWRIVKGGKAEIVLPCTAEETQVVAARNRGRKLGVWIVKGHVSCVSRWGRDLACDWPPSPRIPPEEFGRLPY